MSNNSTAKTRQIFMLFHELAHLLFRTGGVDATSDEFVDRLSRENRRTEVICNSMAARTMVPRDRFDEAIADLPPDRASAQRLAERFSVSREFVYREFRDRDLITSGEYEQAARQWAEQFRSSNGGGNHYCKKIACLGTEYINLAFGRYCQNRIDYDQLADFLDLKPRHLTQLENHVAQTQP